MSSSSKKLAASGLVLMAGALIAPLQAQDYIDVEAERQATEKERGTVTAPVDPYGAKPAQRYPTTSYGMDRAPASAVVAGEAPVGAQEGGQNVGQLLYQVQQLQQEMMRLNGMVEEQAHELRTLKEQSLERYVDLDRRLSGMSGGVSTGDPAASAVSSTPDADTTTRSSSPRTEAKAAPASIQPGEAAAYRAAYDLVRGQQFDQAVTAFREFLETYPNGKYAANAHYWLGELYLVVNPPDLESARQAFTLLLEQYPDNSKVPDALYKLGKVQFMKGNRDQARESLDRVIREYRGTNNSAVKLAQDFINENY